MNDAKLIENLGIFGIAIARAINDTANREHITVEFRQTVRTPVNEQGQLGHYVGDMHHRFGVKSVQDAWPEIVRRATAYQQLEAQLEKDKKDN